MMYAAFFRSSVRIHACTKFQRRTAILSPLSFLDIAFSFPDLNGKSHSGSVHVQLILFYITSLFRLQIINEKKKCKCE